MSSIELHFKLDKFAHYCPLNMMTRDTWSIVLARTITETFYAKAPHPTMANIFQPSSVQQDSTGNHVNKGNSGYNLKFNINTLLPTIFKCICQQRNGENEKNFRNRNFLNNTFTIRLYL